MAAALNYVNNYIFTSYRGMRDCSERKLIVLSDGKDFNGANVRAATASLYRNKKVDVYSFGIGSASRTGLGHLVHYSSKINNNLLPYLSYPNYYAFTSAVQRIGIITGYGTTCSHSHFKK